MMVERIHTVVVGGGQAGLSVSYHLTQRGLSHVVLDAHDRIGDAWRLRWDSLRLFTPARYDGLPGMGFPALGSHFPTKNEMADFLEAYAARFALPVRTGIRVDGLSRRDGKLLLTAGQQQWEANNVVVALSVWQTPRIPLFAREMEPRIRQLHSKDYRRPAQFAPGPLLVVGAGNSGAEIALDAARAGHRTWLAGRHPGNLPFRIDGLLARLLLQRLIIGFAFHHVLTIRTPIGRGARKHQLQRGMPWIRIKPRDISAAGVERVSRVVGIRDGQPLLEDGGVLEPATVIWATGFDPGLAWIRLPVFDNGLPRQERGVVAGEPGLYFVGLPFIYAVSSAMVRGVGRDAEYVARQIAA